MVSTAKKALSVLKRKGLIIRKYNRWCAEEPQPSGADTAGKAGQHLQLEQNETTAGG